MANQLTEIVALDTLKQAIEAIYECTSDVVTSLGQDNAAHHIGGVNAAVGTICFAFSQRFDIPLEKVLIKFGVPKLLHQVFLDTHTRMKSEKDA